MLALCRLDRRRLGRRLSRAALPRTQGWRGARQEAVHRRENRARDDGAAAQRRHGGAGAGLLPPPAPFKIFILLAGVAGISATRLATAIAIGRGVRYLALGMLAVNYGERAMTYLHEHGTRVSLEAVAVVAVGFGAFHLWSKAAPRTRR